MRRVLIFLSAMLAAAIGSIGMFAIVAAIHQEIVAFAVLPILFFALLRVIGGWAVPRLTRDRTGGSTRGDDPPGPFASLRIPWERLTKRSVATWLCLSSLFVVGHLVVLGAESLIVQLPIYVLLSLNIATAPPRPAPAQPAERTWAPVKPPSPQRDRPRRPPRRSED